MPRERLFRLLDTALERAACWVSSQGGRPSPITSGPDCGRSCGIRWTEAASFFHFMGQATRHGAQWRCLSPLQRFAPKHLPDIDEFVELAHNNFFITRQHVSPEGVYRYHQLFRDFLLSLARETCGDDRRGRMLVVMIWKGAATMLIRIQYHDKSEGAVDGTQLQGLIACGEILAFRRASGWVVLGQDPVRQEHADRRCPTSLLNLYI